MRALNQFHQLRILPSPSTACLPTLPINRNGGYINFLDDTFRRHVTFVNRSIIVQLVSSIEGLLQSYCDRSCITVVPPRAKYAKALLERCDACLDNELRSWVKRMTKDGNPAFGDYSEAILKKHEGATKNFKNDWRNFINLISVVRNKGAHGSVTLTAPDIKKIRAVKSEYDFESELGFVLGEGNELQIPLSFLPWALCKLQALASELNGHADGSAYSTSSS